MTYVIYNKCNAAAYTMWENEVDYSFWMGYGEPEKAIEEQPEYIYIPAMGEWPKRWAKVLPKLNRVKLLWAKGRANQNLFDAICTLTTLERLAIDVVSAHNVENLKCLTNLTHLSLGHGSKIESLESISYLKKLRGLTICNFPKINNVEFIEALSGNLKYLSLIGGDYKKQVFDELKPLLTLHSLEELHFGNVKSLEKLDITSRDLPNLKLVNIGRAQVFTESTKQYLGSSDVQFVKS
ncbi:leucine-rich repeat domain-containing protein [Sessilibacter sp. MAH4]